MSYIIFTFHIDRDFRMIMPCTGVSKPLFLYTLSGFLEDSITICIQKFKYAYLLILQFLLPA